MKSGPFWTRLAAISGVGVAGAGVAAYILGSTKDYAAAGEFATKASHNVWGTYVLLIASAGVLLLWFTSISSARLRQAEGGSRRLATAHFGAGVALSALLFMEVAVQWAARTGSGGGLDGLATALLGSPVLAFPAAVFVFSAGLVGTRAGNAVPAFSGVMARLSLLLGIALIGGAGLWLFRDYAWLNDTAFFSFTGWVFVRSVLGAFRWSDLDEDLGVPLYRGPSLQRLRKASTERRRNTAADETDIFEVPALVRKARARNKPARKKSTARKPSALKRPAPKPATPRPTPAARKPARRKPVRRKPAPRPAEPPPPPPPPEPEPVEAEIVEPTESTEEI